MEDENRVIKLKSKDEQVFELPAEAAEISDLVKDSLGDSDDDVIEILRVSSECLQKVVEFLKHYHEEKMKEIPTPLGGSSFNEVCSIVALMTSKVLVRVGIGSRKNCVYLLRNCLFLVSVAHDP